MKLSDTHDGSNDPFEGDKTLLWTSLPSGAKVNKARLTLTPAQVAGGTLFQETIRFQDGQGDWNATKATGRNGNRYVEIDFHNRRTLSSVIGTDLDITTDSTHLLVDMGGVFVEISAQGAVKTPTDPSPFVLPATGGVLPSLTVSKFRFVGATGKSPTITSVVVQSVPSNINVRLGKMGAFWPRPGDLVGTDVSPDFADILQVFLNTAEVKNGFYVVPIVIHSDSIARLRADLEVEYIQQVGVMPDAVKEVVLPFDFGSLPNAQPGVLSVSLPSNARVMPGETAARVLGVFEDTRVVYGPTGEIFPTGTVPLTANDSQAQQFSLDTTTSATAVDLFLAAQPPGVTLAVDLRADFDGKPDATSLLGGPAQATVPSRPDHGPSWISVPLGKEFHFQPKDQARYWLVVQSLQGAAEWGVAPSSGVAVMQHTQDGALSWRETPAPAVASPPAGFFRLRNRPSTFQVPVDLQIGRGKNARRVKLDRFQPLGRVDFNLDIPEVAEGFNQYLAAAPPACSEAEYLANGSFEQWVVVGDDVGNVTPVRDISNSASVDAIAVSSDGTTVYIAQTDPAVNNSNVALVALDAACNRMTKQPIDLGIDETAKSILLYPDGSKALVTINNSLVLVDLLKSVLLASVKVEPAIDAIAFSVNGSKLYVTSESNLFILDTPIVEQALIAGKPNLIANVQGSPLPGSTVALVAGQYRLHVLIQSGQGNSPNQSTLFFADLQTGAAQGPPIPVGQQPLALAVTPDGILVVVANGDKSLVLVDTERTGSPTTLQLSGVPPRVGAVAVSPDGQRAFVVTNSRSEAAVHVIDLAKKSEIPPSVTVNAGQQITSVTITPQGDELYLGLSNNPNTTTGAAGIVPLQYILLGQRLPADWFVTSGKVDVLCLPETSDAHIGVVMAATSGKTGGAIQPSAFSQVAPVSGGCTYEFSFEGLSNDRDAVAEVLWRNANGGSVKTDSAPIPLLTAGSGVHGKDSDTFQLLPVHVRLAAPALATAAEVRFTVPNEKALVAAPSLLGAPQSLLNGNLQQLKAGVPEQWALSPAGAAGFSTTPNGSVMILHNNGPNAADLIQLVPITAGQDFELQFSGHALSANVNAVPRVELRWLQSDGTEDSLAVSENIATAGFDAHPISGQVPSGTSNMEIHLSLPSGTALAIKEVSLRMPKKTSVPVSFIAQSAGELRVSAARVGYDTVPPSPSPVPTDGLPSPTPPGALAGEQDHDSCMCACCASERPTTDSVATMTPAGRPMSVAVCADCGGQVIRGGGKVVRGGPSLPSRSAMHDDRQRLESQKRTPLAAPLLTDVMGIGKARAQELKRAGIKSVRDLAQADPSDVAGAVRGVSVTNAALLIQHARRLLAGRSQAIAD